MSTTFAEVHRTFLKLDDVLDFRRDNLAEEVFDEIANAIHQRFSSMQGVDGTFAANRGKYGVKKRAAGIPVGIGLHNGGDMARLVNFLGQVEIGEDEAVLSFGADDFNRRKGMWFEVGSGPSDEFECSGARNQPPRPFFQMDDKDVDRAFDRIARAVEDYLESI